MRNVQIVKHNLIIMSNSYLPNIYLGTYIVSIVQDCVDNGWVMAGFPTCGTDFETLDTMTTPPNRYVKDNFTKFAAFISD